jgi:hypothetical protein
VDEPYQLDLYGDLVSKLRAVEALADRPGARATASALGFDRFWRNARTHTLHDPVAYKRREVGAFLLRDELPEPTWYSWSRTATSCVTSSWGLVVAPPRTYRP